MSKVLLKNAKIVSHDYVFDGAVQVVDGKIKSVLKNGGLAKESGFDEVYDLEGKYLLPGLIDAHVHFRTPGQEYKEDWITGSKAALAGGVTTVLDMPNNDPSIVSLETLQKKRELVEKLSLVNFGFYIGATADNLDELKGVKGVCGIKVYMGSSTGKLLVDDHDVLEKIMGGTDKLIAVHAEDEDCMNVAKEQFEDKNDPMVHSLIRNPQCAFTAVKRALLLAKKYKTRLHICHVSTELELTALRKFKSENVSSEVTPHHLFFNDMDYPRLGMLLKVNPPVRNSMDQVALWEGIKDGLVDMVVSDHAPHTLEEKQGDYDMVASGVPGVQERLPLLLNAVSEGRLSLEKVVELTSYNPAKKFRLKGKGEITEGMDADFTVVDMNITREIIRDNLFSKCGWSPYEGMLLKGWPVMTFAGGVKMYEWGGKFGDNLGKEVEYV